MVIVAAYPCSFEGGSPAETSPLRELSEELDRIAPPEFGVHLLPFYPSSGDGGFAPTDWFAVDPSLGTFADISAIAAKRRLFVDGIYNHVGIGHRWCRQFFQGNGGRSRIRTLSTRDANLELMSPRGRPIVRRYRIGDADELVWQTFSPESVDINLDDPDVTREIVRHLDFVAGTIGAYGVRLDAPAYYGKPAGGPLRHSVDSIRHFRRIVGACAERDLAVIAQLHSDEVGLAYHSGVPVALLQDYHLPIELAAAILDAEVGSLARHLHAAWDARALRPLRTHDGILLHVGRGAESGVPVAAASIFADHGLAIRVVNDVPYEVNSSFPHICAVGVDRDLMFARIELAITLAMLIPGVPYLYLPILYGWRPEPALRRTADGRSDPRRTNRIPIAREYVDAEHRAGRLRRMRRTLDVLMRLRAAYGLDRPRPGDVVREVGRGVLAIARGGELAAVLNFHPHRPWSGSLSALADRPEIAGNCPRRASVEPCTAKIWELGERPRP